MTDNKGATGIKGESTKGRSSQAARPLKKVFRRLRPERAALQIVAIYVLFGSVWILFSDRILCSHVHDPALVTFISIVKGLTYVLVSGLLFYLVSRRAFRRIAEIEVDLLGSIGERHSMNDRITQLAFVDQLTGLPNRTRLLTEFSAFCRAAGSGACLLLDLDNFKLVNDTFSHEMGDQLLLAVTSRLRAILPAGAFLARIGGDDFVILLARRDADATDLAQRLLAELTPPMMINGLELHVTASMGLALFPEQGTTSDELLRKADAAMYRAKAKGKRTSQLFDVSMHREMQERLAIENRLASALANGELSLHYQPQILATSGSVVMLEALLRWTSPELGRISPAIFIPIAEDSGLIIAIGEWVLRSACQFLQSLHQQGWSRLSISVNISVRQLAQPNFLSRVQSILREVGLAAEFLEIEITETTLIEHFETYQATLAAMMASGVRIALDDFGKGYSSLNYLRQLPVSTLKIDKVFIDDIVDARDDYRLLESIILLGNKLGLTVVAEGVERESQLQFMRDHRCDRLQGYLFCRPLPGSAVVAYLETQTGCPSLPND